MENQTNPALNEVVAQILHRYPDISYKQLVLMVWQIFDGIVLSEEICTQIMERGTNPETICRTKRKMSEILCTREEVLSLLDEAEKDVIQLIGE
jgi:hypothetical protein